jgi:hypothetical protein
VKEYSRFLASALTPDGSLNVAGTPQNLALGALERNTPGLNVNNTSDQQQLIQIYALNTLYFATGGNTRWINSTSWTSAKPVCAPFENNNWVGIGCTPAGEVDSILLDQNNLSGGIPSELRGLSLLSKSNVETC